MLSVSVLLFRIMSGVAPMNSRDLSGKVGVDLAVKLVFAALIFGRRIFFVSAATNIAAGKLVTVSSHDFVFNKAESGWCQNGRGKSRKIIPRQSNEWSHSVVCPIQGRWTRGVGL